MWHITCQAAEKFSVKNVLLSSGKKGEKLWRQYEHFAKDDDAELDGDEFLGINKLVLFVCDAFTSAGTDEDMYVHEYIYQTSRPGFAALQTTTRHTRDKLFRKNLKNENCKKSVQKLSQLRSAGFKLNGLGIFELSPGTCKVTDDPVPKAAVGRVVSPPTGGPGGDFFLDATVKRFFVIINYFFERPLNLFIFHDIAQISHKIIFPQ